ncbi:MAG: diacylglycerol/lipid kinase family protein [Solirubrobacterales bacterium]
MTPTIAPSRHEPETASPAQPTAPGAVKKRMLIIVNPYATTVSSRLKNLVVYALQARYDVEAVNTDASGHAIEIGREAREGGYDIVVAFGGDGTVNEVANGLAGTDVPVSVLPGGATNVVARTLGMPTDVVDATEHLIGLADDFRQQRIDLGTVNGRRFVFACGMGLDATVVKRVDSHPRLKARVGPWYFAWAAVTAFYRNYLRSPVRMQIESESFKAEGVTAIFQNADPFTYFAERPVRVCEGAEFSNGRLSAAVLERAAQRDMPTIALRVLNPRLSAVKHRHIAHVEDLTEARIASLSRDESGEPRRFPIQVDGDYIGEFAEAEIGIEPRALTLVA